jgi:hypothetical protein
MMQKYGSILVSLLILAAAAVGAYRWADALQYSFFTYQSPLSVVRVPPGEPLPAQTQRVVVVIIGGLGDAASNALDMPNYEALRAAGASATMISQPPTYPLPARTTLLTGAWPELNGAPSLEATPTGVRPIPLDHLFAAAQAAGLRTAIAGFEGWKSLLPANTPQASFFTPGQDTIADGQVAQAAFNFIADAQYHLVLIHFSQLDADGQAGGVGSPAYASAARQIDNYLRQIVRLVDTSRSVLIVTSDHGLLEGGQLGGGEPELTQLPFVMIGQGIVPGVYSGIRQVDLAPTVAVLLGTRLPAVTQGRPLYEMMRLDAAAGAQSQLALATQKVALGDAYLMLMGQNGLSQATHQDLASAQQTLLDGNQAGALELARLVAEESAAEMAAAKAARIARERLPRLALVVTGLVLTLILFWARRGANSWLCILAGGATPAIYYGLYRLAGHTFSLSTIGDVGAYFTSLLRYAVAGLAGGALLLLLGLLYRDERRWSAAILAGYDYGLLATWLAALPALLGYWQHGASVRWYLPDLGLTLLHFMSLVQVGVVAALAMALPWLVGLVAWVIGRWRAYSETRAQAWDPIARLRRR